MTEVDNNVNKPRGRTACQDPNKTDKAGRTKIFSSTSSGNLDKVIELIERGANVNHRDHAGWSPLHVAALKGQYEIAKCLIEHGAYVNVRGFEDDAPIHDACSVGDPDCVRLLIENGADVYALNSEKKKPIDLCEDAECIQILKERMNELDRLASTDDQGRTCLHRACIQGSIEDITSCLKLGLNINAIDNDHITPLHYAVQAGHLESVKLLIGHGADINCLDKNNSTLLHIACQNSHEHIVQYLIDAGVDVHTTDNNEKTPYQVTSSVAVRQIITARIDEERKLRATTEAIDEITFVSNSKQKRKNHALSISTSIPSTASSLTSSPLTSAHSFNNPSKLDDTLLSREERKIQAIMRSFENAEKKKQAKRTKPPVSKKENPVNKKRKPYIKESRESSIDGEENKKKTIVNLNKLDPFKKDTSGRTSLHKWAIRGHVEAVDSLLKAGANPCERDNAGYTPLHEAALRGKSQVVELLLMNHADVNCQGTELDTPLHDAAENGFSEVVQLLLEYGADASIKNSKGLTALDIAVEENYKEIESLIKNQKDLTKRKPMTCSQPESPTSPNGLFDTNAKVHARQLSGQHLPKKSFKPHFVKTEASSDGPHSPIPTPPPEKWHLAKKEEEEPILNKDRNLYPPIHCASRYLPLYTIQLYNEDSKNNNHFYVLDLQISLLLGITTYQLKLQYPFLYRHIVSSKEKERLWSPLSPMICSNTDSKEKEKQRFLETDIYFVRLDQIVSIIKDDYSHLSESLITITLDINYSSPSSQITSTDQIKKEDETENNKQSIKLPPKFAMKMKKCGLLNK